MTSNSTLQTVTKIVFIGFLTLVSVVNTFAQDSIVYHNEVINRLNQNKKEGVWKLFAPEDSIYLVCQFNNDTIVGDINIFKSNALIFTIVNPNNERKDFIAYYNSQDTIRGYFATTNDKLTIMDNNDVEITGEKKDWIGKNSTIMPMYYGGQKKLLTSMSNNVATENTHWKKGKVIVAFTIDNNGYVINPTLKQEAHKLLNKEAIRLVSVLPRFQPGFQRGRFVKTKFSVPVIFK